MPSDGDYWVPIDRRLNAANEARLMEGTPVQEEQGSRVDQETQYQGERVDQNADAMMPRSVIGITYKSYYWIL